MKISLSSMTLIVLLFALTVCLVACRSRGKALSSLVDAASADQVNPVEVGGKAPDAKLFTADGKAVTLSSQVSGKPTVLLFYRGGWCPYCNAHLRDVQEIEPALKELGYQILAVSPDRPAKLAETLAKDKLGYALLSDSDMHAARAFGLSFEVDEPTRDKYRKYNIDLVAASGKTHNLLPVPAAFVIDKAGVIRFAYSNPDYKTRVSGEKLLAAAKAAGEKPLSVYDFNVTDAAGKRVALNKYQGKVLLIVNTASKCGFTPQYEGLEKLHQKYKDKGLVVLGFPCNQFGNQEPGKNDDIQSFCQVNYGVTFPVMAKIKVNGSETIPLYKHLKKEATGVAGSQGIKWNFTKFLVDKNGRGIERYGSKTKPSSLTGDIEKLLKED